MRYVVAATFLPLSLVNLQKAEFAQDWLWTIMDGNNVI
jgi:hypothetical protein